MKKIIISFGILIMMCLVVGCGINCPSKPPKRAYFFNGGGYGMSYHVAAYRPASQLSHNPTACTKYEYISFHIYFDEYGTFNGDEIVWKNFQGGDIPFVENGEVQSNITITISKDKIVIKGFRNQIENGTYKIETSSPDSWGVPIDG